MKKVQLHGLVIGVGEHRIHIIGEKIIFGVALDGGCKCKVCHHHNQILFPCILNQATDFAYHK